MPVEKNSPRAVLLVQFSPCPAFWRKLRRAARKRQKMRHFRKSGATGRKAAQERSGRSLGAVWIVPVVIRLAGDLFKGVLHAAVEQFKEEGH